MTNGDIARELGRFTKSGDLHHLHRQIIGCSKEEKIRVAENLRAGDEPIEAIRDAKDYVRNSQQSE